MGLRVPGGGGVSRYSSPRVESSIGRANVVNPSQMSNDLSGAFTRVATAAQDAFTKQKQQADQVAALEQKNKLAEIENNLLYNPENGAFNKRGKNAFGTIQEVNEAYDKAYSDLENSLTNEDQKRMLRQAYQTSRVDMNRQLQRHVSAQAQNYDDETTKSGLEIEQRAVGTNPLDNERRTQAMVKQRIMIDEYATRNGVSNDMRQLMLEDAENKTNLAAISTLVDNRDYKNAKTYFDEVKDHMTGDARSKAERLVKSSYLEGEAMAFTDDVMMKNMSMGEAFNEANKIQDPELRKATITQIRDSFSQRKEADAYNAENINKSVASQIDRGVLWKDIPQTTKDLLTSSQRSTLENYASERTKGRDAASGSQLYYDLFSISTNPATRDQFMKMNLYTDAYGKISKGEFDELYKRQAGLKAGTAKEVNDANALFSNKQITEGIARSNGIYASPSDSKSKHETYTSYMISVDNAVKNFERNTGKKATGDDVRRISESLIIEKKVNDDWFGSTKRRFEALPGEDTEIRYENIPQSEVAAIRQAMQAEGISLSNDDILGIYLQSINGR